MSWSGATAGAVTGAQIGSGINPGLGTLIGAGVGAIGGAIMSRQSDEEKAIEDFYKQLAQGVSREEAAQEKSIAEQKADAAEEQRRATQVARGGVSGAAGGTSGIAMASNLQSEALASKARTAAIATTEKDQAERDIQMKIAGMQGMTAIAAGKRLEQEKAANLLLTSDIGAESLKGLGSGIKEITA